MRIEIFFSDIEQVGLLFMQQEKKPRVYNM